MDAVTHLIHGFAATKHVRHHHGEPRMNKVHAVARPDLEIRSHATATTVCGASITIAEDETSYTVSYNCWPSTESNRTTCKDCRKKLGLPTKGVRS